MFKKLLTIAAGFAVVSLAAVQPAPAALPGTLYISGDAHLGGHSFNCAAGGGCTIYDVPGLGIEIDFGNGESYLLFEDGTLEGAP